MPSEGVPTGAKLAEALHRGGTGTGGALTFPEDS